MRTLAVILTFAIIGCDLRNTKLPATPKQAENVADQPPKSGEIWWMLTGDRPQPSWEPKKTPHVMRIRILKVEGTFVGYVFTNGDDKIWARLHAKPPVFTQRIDSFVGPTSCWHREHQ